MYRKIVDLPPYPFILVANKGFLVYCCPDSQACDKKLNKILKQCGSEYFSSVCDPEEDKRIIEEACRQLLQYFSGERKEFEIPIKTTGTDFQQKVWSELLRIPFGETISYKKLSERCDCQDGYRAVANACGANPVSILVPCHRVIGSSGVMGGYTGGRDIKTFLLQLEKNSKNF